MDLFLAVLAQLGSIVAGVWALTEILRRRYNWSPDIVSLCIGAPGALLAYLIGALPALDAIVSNTPLAAYAATHASLLWWVRCAAALLSGLLGTLLARVAHDTVIDPLMKKVGI